MLEPNERESPPPPPTLPRRRGTKTAQRRPRERSATDTTMRDQFLGQALCHMLRFVRGLVWCKKPESKGLHPWREGGQAGRQAGRQEESEGGAGWAVCPTDRPVLLSDHNKTPLHLASASSPKSANAGWPDMTMTPNLYQARHMPRAVRVGCF